MCRLALTASALLAAAAAAAGKAAAAAVSPPPPPPPAAASLAGPNQLEALPPTLTATNFSRGAFAAPAFLTNGFMGLRPGPVPLLADPFAGAPTPLGFDPTVPATVAGFMYRDISLHVVPAPAVYPFATAVLVDGTDILRAAGAQAVPISQTLNVSSGELHTELRLASGGVDVALNVTMFVSRSEPTVAAMRVAAAIVSPGHTAKNLTLAPALSLTPAACRNETVGQPDGVGANCSVPAVEYSFTIPDKTMPGWAAWVWDHQVHHMGAVTNSGSRLGLAALPNVTMTKKGVIYEVLVSVVSDAVSGAHDPVLAAYEHVERAAYLGGHDLYSPPTAATPGGFATLQRKDRDAWAVLWQASQMR